MELRRLEECNHSEISSLLAAWPEFKIVFTLNRFLRASSGLNRETCDCHPEASLL